ncbi:quinon protein alcohol dehydrogenase-like superfamily [Hygrophoropsis aurantiaca]|uniref:Quinon protein alcohol dehydrogenase-like superfamily n=1 Tax=Hygrophoropsis aurantiaca TaxID=72124 RepID=A0ACB7ZYH8_9AGAM|nr:quinon protein alcohol dehydrogenase-like superfamily [Hygrophoropsis aurantiaca]
MSTSTSPEVGDGSAMQHRAPTKVFLGHPAPVTSVAYFNDGKRIISGSRDKTIRIWNVETQKQEGDSMMHDFVVKGNRVALSPDERALVSAMGGMVLWDLESRTVIWKRDPSYVLEFMHCVAYSPNGKLIAAGHSHGIELLDAKTGQLFQDPLHFCTGEPIRNGEWPDSLAFSPDGMRVAEGSHHGKVQVFDVATGELVVKPFDALATSPLIFTPDGQQIITASSGGYIRVWDAATGQQVSDPIPAHKEQINDLALNADGRRIASASIDGTVRVWDLATRRQIGDSLQTQHKESLWSAAWSPDGRSIIAGELGPGSNIHLWDIPPFDDVSAQVPVLAKGSPPLPLDTATSLSRSSSLSSSILNSPAGPAPPQSPEPNTGPDEDPNWEYSTNESFNSLLDLNADGTQPTRRRKRRRRRRAPATSTSPPPTPTPAIAQPNSHPPQSQAPPPSESIAANAPADTQISASRFGSLARFWKKMAATIARRTPPSHDNYSEIQQSQGGAGRNPSEPSQAGGSLPRERRQRNARRSDDIGMIAPSPMYERYGVATEEYWYDPDNPPLIDRIFFCMICCGDDASYITSADPDPEPSTDAQAGSSHSQNQPVPVATNATTFASANPSTSTPHLGKVRRLWRHVSNLVLRPLYRKKQEDRINCKT